MKTRAIVQVFCFAILSATSTHAQFVEIRDGTPILHLNPDQQNAVDDFLAHHQELKLVNCPGTGPDQSYCRDAYRNYIAAVKAQNARPQYPSATWGDFRGTGLVDFVVAFHSDRVVNSFGGRFSEVVVFENLGENRFRPVVAWTGGWGNCLDGILFHPVRKQLEMWCNTQSASAKWNGTAFVGKTRLGD
jgi:hypothetical protein